MLRLWAVLTVDIYSSKLLPCHLCLWMGALTLQYSLYLRLLMCNQCENHYQRADLLSYKPSDLWAISCLFQL